MPCSSTEPMYLSSKPLKGIDHVKTMHVDNSGVDAEVGPSTEEAVRIEGTDRYVHFQVVSQFVNKDGCLLSRGQLFFRRDIIPHRRRRDESLRGKDPSEACLR